MRSRATVIVIAHKLNTIRHADRIIVLSDSGEVAQIGTHDTLIGEVGIYRQFWKQRNRAIGWKLTQ